WNLDDFPSARVALNQRRDHGGKREHRTLHERIFDASLLALRNALRLVRRHPFESEREVVVLDDVRRNGERPATATVSAITGFDDERVVGDHPDGLLPFLHKRPRDVVSDFVRSREYVGPYEVDSSRRSIFVQKRE